MHSCLAASFGVWCVLTAVTATAADEAPAADLRDSRLQAATEWVMRSDRYLHHSKVRRGMTGYGLTVMEGTKIVRFDVEVVSVITNIRPQRDLILVQLKGQGLEHTGLISGMSGSPVFVRDGDKDKMIGAIGYQWRYHKAPKEGPLGLIQPISQMLALAGGPLDKEPPAGESARGRADADAILSAQWRSAAFDPRKIDFTRFDPDGVRAPRAGGGDHAPASMMIQPLAMPLMAGGLCDRAMAYLTDALAGSSLLPVQAGGPGEAAAEEAGDVKLAPGASLTIPLAIGDEKISAIGTVTDVIDGKVIAFGHQMNGDGAISLPMATGYVHAVVPSIINSFKLGGTGRIVGELNCDEYTAVGGTLGKQVEMIPMTIQVAWDQSGQMQTYRYRIVRDRSLTPALAVVLTMDTLWGTRRLPTDHTVEYSVEVDFGQLGSFRVSNLSSGRDIRALTSDLSRPIALLLNNPFGMARVNSIAVETRMLKGARMGLMLQATPDRNSYAPGDTARVAVTLRRFKGPRSTKTVDVPIPADLPDGEYTIQVGDWEMALEAQRQRQPRLFDPRNLPELLAAIQRVSQVRMDRLYAVLELPGKDLAVRAAMLADAPPTIVAALEAIRPMDVSPIGRAVTVDLPMDVAVTGSAEVTITVKKHPSRP